MFRRKKVKNQIIEKAEQIIVESGFTGVVENDFKTAETTKEKQAFLIETLLYKYEHSPVTEKNKIENQLAKEIETFSKILYAEPEAYTPESLYEKTLKDAEIKATQNTITLNGETITIKADKCGEYYNGEDFVPVKSVEILLNEECLYSDIPTEGIWTCSTNYSGMKMINYGTFDCPRDAFGYIDYVVGG